MILTFGCSSKEQGKRQNHGQFSTTTITFLCFRVLRVQFDTQSIPTLPSLDIRSYWMLIYGKIASIYSLSLEQDVLYAGASQSAYRRQSVMRENDFAPNHPTSLAKVISNFFPLARYGSILFNIQKIDTSISRAAATMPLL